MSEFFSTFSFRALWTPELIIVLLVVIYIYYWVSVKQRHKFIGAEDVPFRQKVYFGLALLALYLGWGSPLYVAGHISMTLHMVQMIFAYFVSVPLFILATPKWVFRTWIHRWEKKSPRTYKVVMFPIFAMLFFNGLFSIYHIPRVFDALMQSPFGHSAYLMVLFVAAFLMWWHMLAPLPTSFQLPELRRIIYIFGNGILITPACALIIFAGNPMYETYMNPAVWQQVMAYCLPPGSSLPPEILAEAGGGFAFLDPQPDQQLGGVIMKVAQELTYTSTIGYVFRQWMAKEKLQDGEVTISDVPTTDTINSRS
ncbi:cytochrome c oxidase assembly factor CtaG [Aliibacillus thermotolerans]|uniref:Cytochrome c oxidase assembly factor CtaG n=1 Tax=Aliibacillus thermotolerans TaxID=1834418 RepID=A0ABW0U685_9BACI|nr:cytochrome c oxidase assembly factor CtaG [Aliibacillus thermotolerans]MDA3129180.1 cytochrome c oxidase assembly factor CtaG [Aliibacillus thermotolerans]